MTAHLFTHLINLLDNIRPEVITIPTNGGDNSNVQAVQPVEHHNLLLGLLQLRIRRDAEPKQLLAR
jgi:hypothetical protein